MSDIRGLVQTTLDTELSGAMFVHWQLRVEIQSDPNPNEYVVYTLGGDNDSAFADNEPLVKSADVTLRYYYRKEKLNTHAGREAVKSRENSMLTAMKTAGFYTPSGFFDAGDIDGIGYMVSVSEWSYARVV